MNTLTPFSLLPHFAGRTWGRNSLLPWYTAEALPPQHNGSEPIGEAWLTGGACTIADGPHEGETLAGLAKADPGALLGDFAHEKEFPLLVKMLFPDGKLSVQVHPDDDEARAYGIARGKTECWYVLAAEPGAMVACGLQPGVTKEALHASILSGDVEPLLQFLPVEPGDMVFVDAGTVHAIGPGVTLLEVQQTCDTTYRLFDYGRPRELHLDKGLAVTKLQTRAGKVAPQPLERGTRLIGERYFSVDSFPLHAGETLTLNDAGDKPHAFIALRGSSTLTTQAGSTALQASNAAIVPANSGPVTLTAESHIEVVRTMP